MSKKMAIQAMIIASALSTLAYMPGALTSLGPDLAPPHEYTEDEKAYLASLNPNARQMWRGRFQRGLSKTEREFVNARIAEMKE